MNQHRKTVRVCDGAATPGQIRKPLWFRRRFALALSLFAITAAHFSKAQGADAIYTDQTTFLASIQPGYYLETFDSLPKDFVSSPQPFSLNGFAYTASAAGDFFNVGPGNDVWLSTSNNTTGIVFVMTSNNVTAIGGYFFLTDLDGNITTGTVTATLDDGSTFSIVAPSATSFIGFTSSMPIQSLTVTPDLVTFATVNDFIAGTTVPEPSSLLLLAVGAVISAIAYRRHTGANN